LARAQRLARARLTAAMLAYVLLLLFAAGKTLALVLGWPVGPLRGVPLLLALGGLVFVAPLYGIIARTPSPGAGDNLIASAIAVRVAAHFAARRQRGEPLRHTRLVLLSTDGEEAGQRGAIAYAERHRDDLLALPTSVLNVDSIYRQRDLAVVTHDRHGTQPLSPVMARECRDLAQAGGWRLAELKLPLGGGGTDAAAFARIGVAATTIVAVSTTPDGSQVYHTAADTVERIEPAAVAAVCDLAVRYVIQQDARA
jgi:aminopeptidase YwaD